MIKQLLIFVALCIPGLGIAQESPNRLLGLTTQDQNGLFIVLVSANSSGARVSVRQFSSGHPGKPEIFPYPVELFDELWANTKDLGLSGFAATNTGDLHPAENYVITIGAGDADRPKMYAVPKCSASPAIASFVKRLAHDLLPAGSPGLFKPCP